MNLRKFIYKFSLSLISIFLASGSTFAQSLNSNYKVLESNNNSVRIIFSPQVVKESELVNGANKVRYRYSNGSILSKPGEPEIPVHTFVIGIPQSATPNVNIISSLISEERGVEVIPIPFYVFKEDLGQYRFPESYSLENQDAWFPSNPVIVEEPAYFSDLRILRIHVAPLQYHIKNKTVRRYQQMELKIDFDNQSPGFFSNQQSSQISQTEVKLYKSLVLNYEQAKNWLQSRKRNLKKVAQYWLQGEYYKFNVVEDGLYQVTGSTLQENGIDINSIDPATIKLFNNGPEPLPRNINAERPDKLIENAIQLIGMDDGRFDPTDYILFYGTGVKGWRYSSQDSLLKHFVDPYTYDNIYWLTFNDGVAGKRITPIEPPTSFSATVTSYDAITFIEDDINNINNSGLNWYGKQFIGGQGDEEQTFSLNLPNMVSPSLMTVRGNFLSTAGISHSFDVLIDGESIGSFNFFGSRVHASSISKILSNPSSTPNLTLRYSGSSGISIAYLDWLEITAESVLSLVNNQLDFYGEIGSEAVEYLVGGATESGYKVYNITDLANIQEVPFSLQSATISFRDYRNPNKPNHYFIGQSDQFKTVSSIARDESSDLRNTNNGTDFLIITHESFSNAASSLKNLRESVDGLNTTVVKITDVFDEFSGGRYDPTAIRDFLKYVYDFWSTRPQYILLFGDGDYDYRNILSNNDENWIPTYQTEEPDHIANRTLDDWFTYVNGNDRVADYTIGRIPSQTTKEAEDLVDKLVEYESAMNYGPWRNLITVVADDELVPAANPEVIHTRDSEDLAENHIPKRFDVRKIYLTEYPIVYDASASGIRKPDAAVDLLAQINEGSLIINFIGHGNPRLWTHERVLLDSRDFDKIQNDNRYIFFITATCDFGRFDDPLEQSFAERLLLVEKKGAIGLLTSARLVYASSNARFNKSYMDKLFDDPANPYRIGDAMRLAKVDNRPNDEKFHILGDPTLKLKVPRFDINISDLSPDSLKALSLVSVSGNILDENNAPFPGSGNAFMKTFDSRRQVTYTASNNQRINYFMQGNPLFRGSGSVDNGQFNMNFIVPKDISYGGRQGRISIYFEGEETDGTGYIQDLIVDGTADDLIDNDGPEINFVVKGNDVIDFILMNQQDEIEIIIEDDKSGINITGDVGHKITATADDNVQSIQEVTHLFEYETNNYLKGSLKIPLSLFSEFQDENPTNETHRLTIKAWDNANNSSKQSLSFTLVNTDDLIVENVLNYPNPFMDNTTFTFVLNSEADIEIKVFSIAGRLVTELEPFLGQFGFNMREWDGRDQDGDELANGTYLYRLKAKNTEGSSEFIGKLVKMK